MKKLLRPLSSQIIVALVLGLVLGPQLVPFAPQLGEVSKLLIQLIKAIAAPLLFFAIMQAILKAEITRRNGLRMVGVATFNVCIALAVGLGISNFFQPGVGLQLKSPEGAPPVLGQKIEFIKTLGSYLPANLVQPWAENNIIPIVFLALMLGFALRRARSLQLAAGQHSFRPIEGIIDTLYQVFEIILTWIVRLTPIAVFAAVAKSVAENGYSHFGALAFYVLAAILGMVAHVFVTYQLWIKFYARLSLKRFWREARAPVIFSIGANSSLATLPLTLKALDKLGISKRASALGACVGTNLNNDGIILYEGMAVLFMAQAYGIHLDLGQQIITAATCLIAAMGVAGVPEAGFISLSIILVTLGLPTEALPLLLTVDWVIARARSATNVLSDMVVSIVIDGRKEHSEV